MNLYDFPPIAALIQGASWLVTQLSDLLIPLAGVNSAALAVVLLTILVRAVLIPVGRSQVRATITRQRLAPRIAELQTRHKKDPERLGKELTKLYAAEKTSPFAGLLPVLAQTPVLMAVYGLFILPTVAGQPNLLLGHTLLGVGLDAKFFATLTSGVISWPTVAVFACVMAAIALVAYLSRRFLAVAPLPTSGLPRALSYLPFATVLVAGVVPLAAALYLVTTTTWTFVERLILHHLYGVGSPSGD